MRQEYIEITGKIIPKCCVTNSFTTFDKFDLLQARGSDHWSSFDRDLFPASWNTGCYLQVGSLPMTLLEYDRLHRHLIRVGKVSKQS